MTQQADDNAQLRVGPAAYMPAGIVTFHQYESGETAIQIIDEGGDELCVATTALVPSGAPHPGTYGLWLKGWSENEGVPEALVAAGIVTLTGRTYRTGFALAQHAELTERARNALDRFLAEH